MQLVTFINMGGPINWLLFALMCFSFCQCVERGIYFFQTRKNASHSVIHKYQKVLATVTVSEDGDFEKVIERESEKLYYEMNRGLWFLNFISSVAPSIGLLGTVTGLISAFSKMAASTAVNIQDLSGGIWEAMLTTAFGMIISIPTLLFYRMFRRIIEKRLYMMNQYENKAKEKL